MCRNPHKTETQDHERARRLRRDSSPYEQKLWFALRQATLFGKLKFRRQQPIHPYIADFACMKAKLVIELDGMSHDVRQDHDLKRDAYFKEQGYTVMRISNNEVSQKLDAVVEAIMVEAKRLLFTPSPAKTKDLLAQAQVFASSPSRGEENNALPSERDRR